MLTFFRLLLATVALVALPVVAATVPHYETRTITSAQADAQTWQTATFATPFPGAPVVITGPTTCNDVWPVTVRLRNVTATGFEYQLDEWDYEDGIHKAESFSYLAIEPGTFQLGAATWQAGRVAGISDVGQDVAFATSFTGTPVVLAQVESATDPRALVPRVQFVTPTQFHVRVQTQLAGASPVTGESVAYLACTQGVATLDGAPFRAGLIPHLIGREWYPVAFGGSYANPYLFAQTQTANSVVPPGSFRQHLLTSTSVGLFLQPEASKIATPPPWSEATGYLVMAEAQGELRARLEVGSFQRAQADRTTWSTVTFDQPYTSPVVVFGPLAEGEVDPATIRVRNVTSQGFEFQVQEWSYEDGAHGPDAVSYMVAEAGVYKIGGVQWVFGHFPKVTTTATPQNFARVMPVTPAVFVQVTTVNGADPVHARVTAANITRAAVELQVEAAGDVHHPAENVDYVAITPGSGRLAALRLIFQAGLSSATVTDAFTPLAFTRTFVAPFFFAESQSNAGPSAIVPRYRNLGEKSVEVSLQEETSRDPNTTHPAESISYLAFSSAIDSDEDGIPDSWEIAHGLNPNDPADAGADPDGDGHTNLQEFLEGTDPQVPDSGVSLTLSVMAANAYKKEGMPAKFQIARAVAGAALSVQYTLSGAATPPGQAGAEYRVTDAGGATLSGTVSLTAGATTAEIDVVPIADGSNRYPESIVLTVAPSAAYQVSGTPSATVTIADAAPTPGNDQLFVAFLTSQNGAQTYASGIGTLYLNGPKNAARVSLSFSGLTSPQTNAYLRYGIPGGVGSELRATLGTGQVTDVPWTIVPVGPYTGQNIIDALFQKNGQYTYVNLGTGNYPAGEIAGTWMRQTGATTTFTPPGAPPAIAAVTGSDLTREVSRFLTQATFGPTQADIDALTQSVTTTYQGDRIAAFGAWIDAQLALPQTTLLDLTQAADAEEWAERGTDPINFTTGNEPRENNRRRSWWLLATKAPDQLRQRFAFALSEFFVISDQFTEVRTRHYGTALYYDQLAAAATGNYRTLLETVSKSPMMGKYLSSLENQKAVINQQTGQVIVSPDENYAREIMQLFSIGLVYRFPDGSLELGANGAPIQTYSNADITDLARVFTGWSFSMKNGSKATGYPVQTNTTFILGDGPLYFQAEWTNPMTNFAAYHDTGAKTVLGQGIAAGLDGQGDLTAALNIIAGHQNVAPFVARQLIERLVTSNPSAGYIYRVAQKFADNGSGVRGDFKTVLKAILLDYEARSLDVVSNVGYGKQKEPLLRYVQLLRALGGKSSIPLTLLSGYGYPPAQMAQFPSGTTLYRYGYTDAPLSQTPQSAPTVFNWFLPDFNPGGAIASAGLVAPEMQLTTETTVAAAINYHYTLAETTTGQSVSPLVKPASPTQDDIILDRTPFEAVYNSAVSGGQTVPVACATLLDALDVLLTAGNLKATYATAAAPNPRSIILTELTSLGNVTTTTRVEEALYLLLTTPEYLHQK